MTPPAELTPADVAGRLADRFDEAALPYAFGGALALGAWGVPRATSDVDVAVFAGEDRLDTVIDALERAGATVDPEKAQRSVATAGFFVAWVGPTRVDVFVAHHPWHVDMERRRVALPTPTGSLRWFLSAEDITVAKLIYGRPKDVSDLERLFATQAGRLDFGYIREWTTRIVPAADPRHGLLADLVRRFGE